ncbi:MAG: hypothetical protein ACI83W_001546, partial [Marinoscillum sp.]
MSRTVKSVLIFCVLSMGIFGFTTTNYGDRTFEIVKNL